MLSLDMEQFRIHSLRVAYIISILFLSSCGDGKTDRVAEYEKALLGWSTQCAYLLPDQAENILDELSTKYRDVSDRLDPITLSQSYEKLSLMYLWQNDYHKSHFYDVKCLEIIPFSNISDFDKGRFVYTYLLALNNQMDRDAAMDQFIRDHVEPSIIEAAEALSGKDTQQATNMLDNLVDSARLPRLTHAWVLWLLAEFHQTVGAQQQAVLRMSTSALMFNDHRPRDPYDASIMPYLTYRMLLLDYETDEDIAHQQQLAQEFLAYSRTWNIKYQENARDRIVELYGDTKNTGPDLNLNNGQ